MFADLVPVRRVAELGAFYPPHLYRGGNRLEACKVTDAESRPSNLQVSALPLAAIYPGAELKGGERRDTDVSVPDRCGCPWHNFCQGETSLKLQLKRKHRDLPAGPFCPVPRCSPVGHPGDTHPPPSQYLRQSSEDHPLLCRVG